MNIMRKGYVCVPKVLQRKIWREHLQGKTLMQSRCEYRIAEIDGNYYVECRNKDSDVWDIIDSVHPTAMNKHNYGW